MSGERRTPVIGDVARLANVSVPTVSRVLNGTTPVSEELRARVERAIEELGYIPNGAARALSLGRRSLIAVLAGNTSRFGWARTIEGIEDAARRNGFSIIVAVVESAEEDAVARALELVLAENVAGVIVLEFDEQGQAVLGRLPSSVPAVAVAGAKVGSQVLPYALLDEETAGREVTDYLLSLGHETVHHIAQPTMGRITARTAGWRSALEARGAVVPDIVHVSWEPSTAYQAALQLASQADVTAIFCANDDIALAAIRAIADSGLDVPADISIVGFDDLPLSAYAFPPLTTVRQDFNDLGARAFALLARSISGAGRPSDSVTTPALVERATAGVARKRFAQPTDEYRRA